LVQDVDGNAEKMSVEEGDLEKIRTEDRVENDQDQQSTERPSDGRMKKALHGVGVPSGGGWGDASLPMR
jgi:hypothetical protein